MYIERHYRTRSPVDAKQSTSLTNTPPSRCTSAPRAMHLEQLLSSTTSESIDESLHTVMVALETNAGAVETTRGTSGSLRERWTGRKLSTAFRRSLTPPHARPTTPCAHKFFESHRGAHLGTQLDRYICHLYLYASLWRTDHELEQPAQMNMQSLPRLCSSVGLKTQSPPPVASGVHDAEYGAPPVTLQTAEMGPYGSVDG